MLHLYYIHYYYIIITLLLLITTLAFIKCYYKYIITSLLHHYCDIVTSLLHRYTNGRSRNRRILVLPNDTVNESFKASSSASVAKFPFLGGNSVSTTGRCFVLSVVAIWLPNNKNSVHGGPQCASLEALPAAPVTNDSSEKAQFRVDMSKWRWFASSKLI